MSTTTLPKPTGTGSLDDLHHIVCCDQDTAMCGLDVSDHPWEPTAPNPCLWCAHIDEARLPCTVAGCTEGSVP